MSRIHPTAVIDPAAELATDVQVGPYAILDGPARLGAGTVVLAHTHVGRTVVGTHCRLGPSAYVGLLAIVSGNEAISQDVPPFAAVRYGRLKGYNAVGCRRAGLGREALHAVRSAFSCLRRARLMSTAVDDIRRAGLAEVPEVTELRAFLAATRRGILPAQFTPATPSPADDGHLRIVRRSDHHGRTSPVGVPQPAGYEVAT